MAITIQEGRFYFTFNNHAAAIKLDEVAGYVNYEKELNRFRQTLSKATKSSLAGIKDIDFVCATKKDILQLIEVKDYSGGDQRKGLMDNLAKFNDEDSKGFLPKEVAVKVIDTLLALTVSLSNEADISSKTIKTAFSEFIQQDNLHLSIVLWLFYDKSEIDERRAAAQLHSVRDKLAKNLRCLGSSTRVRVDIDHNDNLSRRYNIYTTIA